MPENAKFWVLPCKVLTDSWVIYTEDNFEILVEVKNGKIVYHSVPLTEAQRDYFEKYVLTKNE